MQLTNNELLEHLAEQRDWLQSSADRFDAGVLSEAKRLASVVRTLLQSDGALLAQLGVREAMPYADSVGDQSNALFAMGLVSTVPGPSGFSYGVALNDISDRSSFDAWWNNIVMKSVAHGGLRRRDIVLKLANKDGGSHVDPVMPQAYRAITRDNGMEWIVWTESGEDLEHPGNPVPWAMRKIAHEMTITLDQQFPA